MARLYHGLPFQSKMLLWPYPSNVYVVCLLSLKCHRLCTLQKCNVNVMYIWTLHALEYVTRTLSREHTRPFYHPRSHPSPLLKVHAINHVQQSSCENGWGGGVNNSQGRAPYPHTPLCPPMEHIIPGSYQPSAFEYIYSLHIPVVYWFLGCSYVCKNQLHFINIAHQSSLSI